MEHPQIDAERVVDRYLVGRLSSAEEALFEEHLFICGDCLEQVEAGDELRRGLRAVAAEEATRAAVSLGLVAWLRSRRPTHLAGLVSLALACVLLPATLVWQQAELNRLRTAPQSVAGGFVEPLGDFSVISLGVVRDAPRVVEIRPQAGKAVLLSLELQTVDAARYRVTLGTEAGEVLWTDDDLEPSLYETLLLALPPSFLQPGSYHITVEGLGEEGIESAGEMEFRVLPKK